MGGKARATVRQLLPGFPVLPTYRGKLDQALSGRGFLLKSGFFGTGNRRLPNCKAQVGGADKRECATMKS